MCPATHCGELIFPSGERAASAAVRPLNDCRNSQSFTLSWASNGASVGFIVGLRSLEMPKALLHMRIAAVVRGRIPARYSATRFPGMS